jgi:hypothetical protein
MGDEGGMSDITTIIGSAEWLAHRYDPTGDTVHFRHVARAVHARATFITEEYLPKDAQTVVLRRQDCLDALAAGPGSAPVHFVFHSAYCCSTLVARAFDAAGMAMGLKEPVILNDIVGWRRRGGSPDRVAGVLDSTLALLARPFGPGERVIVKPSNIFNGFAAATLGLRPDACALMLYAPLPSFLRSIARKGMWGRLWARELFAGQLKDGLVDLGFAPDDYLKLTDLQVAAVGWLAQHALFNKLSQRFGARVATLDSETLLANPEAAISALAALYSISMGAQAVAAIAGGPAFSTNSKSGEAFSARERDLEQAEAATTHAEEIDKVAIWAGAVAGNAGVPMTLPNALC